MKVQQLCSNLYYKELFLTPEELDGKASCYVSYRNHTSDMASRRYKHVLCRAYVRAKRLLSTL